MLKIPIKHKNINTELIILNSKFYISDTKIVYYEFLNIKSLHIKNSKIFLIKIRLDPLEPIILEFENMHLRDFTKAILYSKIISPEEIQKVIIKKYDEIQNIYETIFKNKNNLNEILNSKLWNHVSIFNPNIYFQQENLNIYSSNFISIINQPIIDLFISLNCTLNQFYNLFINTYFYNIKNPKTSLDRLINERLRGFSGEINYASRINSLSILNTTDIKNVINESKKYKKSILDFKPNSLFIEKNKSEEKEKGKIFKLKLGKLNCNFEPDIIKAKPIFNCEIKELKFSRDMCRIVYMNDTNFIQDALKFNDELKRIIENEFGLNGIIFLERLFPKFYLKKSQ